ncbi:OHCU decarboxylase [Alsobacter soli]|uniref:2-oxo-4-hydroxy-4-carboxy-5-ureidoimidazoline decarboxylase n=1 Tax=Alsobacter soli TaxID=2109933 RepID=A0A2T1HS46_9HYPH|nr:2-oxo-4-hydroxy-4-carboxy-5-ureidoimidazoline decarboxylase [Alsobacter soli]PSC04490.1 OHCU decarboxylase [Alsobacter soli]
MTGLPLTQVNELSHDDFLRAFAGIAEDAPWVAERADAQRPFADRPSMVNAFQRVIVAASEAEQTALLRAHPDLAGRAAVAGELTSESTAEQAGAGLGSLTQAEFARFTALNEAYKARFGIPFILAVKGADKHQILASFEARLHGALLEERLTALAQVLRIVRFRLEEKVAG